ncbi:MAG: FliM/FliN family flagellar motor C-terminal domain-containing protein [Bacillus subtilis]|nr:FliM/FliN family flagellar motor C-terminal domain-containing protein [Bacillus subtilis]
MEPELLPEPEKPFDILQFKDSCVRVNALVGKTKITLEDIKNLEPEDIVVLENSHLHFMYIKDKNSVKFSVNPDPRLALNIGNSTGGKSIMNEPNSKNIWDNLLVEIGSGI